jgi:hypothetical protein
MLGIVGDLPELGVEVDGGLGPVDAPEDRPMAQLQEGAQVELPRLLPGTVEIGVETGHPRDLIRSRALSDIPRSRDGKTLALCRRGNGADRIDAPPFGLTEPLAVLLQDAVEIVLQVEALDLQLLETGIARSLDLLLDAGHLPIDLMILVKETAEMVVRGLEAVDIVAVFRQLDDQRVVEVGHHGSGGLCFSSVLWFGSGTRAQE